jgi:predicted GNAT family acetyltransferase
VIIISVSKVLSHNHQGGYTMARWTVRIVNEALPKGTGVEILGNPESDARLQIRVRCPRCGNKTIAYATNFRTDGNTVVISKVEVPSHFRIVGIGVVTADDAGAMSSRSPYVTTDVAIAA